MFRSKLVVPVVVVAALVAAALAPGMLSAYSGFVVAIIAINLIACLGLNVLVGYSGQLSLAQAAFMGIGAYTFTLARTGLGWPVLLAAVAAIVLPSVLGAVLAVPATRLTGFYLALVTLGFQYIFLNTVTNYSGLTGGSSGLMVPPIEVGGVPLPRITLERVILVALVLCLLVVRNIRHSHLGRTLVAVRDNENAARIVGVHIPAYRTAAFVLSSALAGFAGALLAIYVGFVDPGQFGIGLSIEVLIVIFVGGAERLVGIVVAGIVVFGSTQFLAGADEYRELVFNVALLMFVLFAPRGISGLVDRVRRRRRSEPPAPHEASQPGEPLPAGEASR